MTGAADTAIIVEDNEHVRAVLRRFVEEWGLEVLGEAADGEAGVALARRVRPSIVLMDFRLPGMDGLEATRRIVASVPAVRVVVLSASEGPAMEGRAAAAGAFAFVSKDSAGALRDALELIAPRGATGVSAPDATDARPGRSASG